MRGLVLSLLFGATKDAHGLWPRRELEHDDFISAGRRSRRQGKWRLPYNRRRAATVDHRFSSGGVRRGPNAGALATFNYHCGSAGDLHITVFSDTGTHVLRRRTRAIRVLERRALYCSEQNDSYKKSYNQW